MPYTPPPATPTDNDAVLASSPSTPANELARIAQSRPDLHPLIAANPSAYPELLDWLAHSDDPAVHAALTARNTPSPAPTVPPPSATPASSAGTPTPAGAPTPASPLGAAPFVGTPVAPNGLTAAPQKKSRGKRTAIILTAALSALLVVLLVLALLYFFLPQRNESDHEYSRRWLNGYTQVWSEPSDSNADYSSLRISPDRSHVVRIENFYAKPARITSFLISPTGLKEEWSKTYTGTINPETYFFVWGSSLVIADNLYDLKTGEESSAPWPEKSTISSDGQRTIACSAEGECSLWTNLTTKKWTTQITGPKTDVPTFIRLYNTMGSGANEWTTTSDYNEFVNLDTGEAHELDRKKEQVPDFVFHVPEGLIIVDGKDAQIYSHSGEFLDSFTLPKDLRERTEFPGPGKPPTQDEAVRWLKDGDTSWAPTTWTIVQDKQCQTFVHDDTRVELSEFNYPLELKNGSCVFSSPPYISFVNSEGLLSFSGYTEAGTFVDMVSGKYAQLPPYALESNLVTPDYLLTVDKDGTVKGYVPKE